MRWLLLAVTGGALLSGCFGGGDGVDSSTAERELESQRASVRDAAAGLARDVLERVDGQVLDSDGRFEGCESAFNDEFRNFRYTATVRIAGGAGEDLDALVERATAPGVRVSLRAVPAGGSSGDWLVLASGEECVDVPEDEREEWLRRDEPSPSVL